jgi:hypothetical protein
MRPGFSRIDRRPANRPLAGTVHAAQRAIYEVRATGVKVPARPLEAAFNRGYRLLRIGCGLPAGVLRQNAVLLKRINVIWVVQSSIKKYSRSLLTQITCISLAIPAHTKGRFAIVTDVRLGMRWTRVVRLTSALSCGRRSRVVLTPRRWRQVGESNFAGEGGKKARSPGRARRKPLTPSRAGMPGVPVRPW